MDELNMVDAAAPRGQTGKVCPVCGKPNQCRSDDPGACWCKGLPVSRQKLEAALGAFTPDQVCLCPECLARFTDGQ